jgi:phosphonatase-like hydrolase
MKPELVVFDMAGTTVYDGDAVNRSLHAALTASGVSVTRDEINEVMGWAKPLAIQTLMLRKTDDPASVTEEKVADAYERFLGIMLDYYRTEPSVKEIPGASMTFRSLKAAGVKVALDTGFSRPIADAIIERLGWLENGLIDASVTSDEGAAGRPAPDMIFLAMERTGVSDARLVAKAGDTPSDLQQGTAAGCGWVIGVTEGSHTSDQLAPYPHTHLVPNVTHLPGILLAEEG